MNRSLGSRERVSGHPGDSFNSWLANRSEVTLLICCHPELRLLPEDRRTMHRRYMYYNDPARGITGESKAYGGMSQSLLLF